MLKEAIELIQQTARDATAAQIVPIETHGRMVYVRHGDAIVSYPLPPAPRRHVVDSLDDLIRYLIEWRNCANSATVWHGHSEVVAVLDDEDRRDTVSFRLEVSAEFNCLSMLGAGEPRAYAQRQFIKLLRVDLAGCLDDPTIVGTFRQLDWSHNQDGKSSVQHGKESLGKSINAKVQGTAELPEELLFHVPVYINRGERNRYPVRCAVEVDPYGQTFQLIPLPGQLDAAIDAAQASIRSRLDTGLTGVGVFAGSP